MTNHTAAESKQRYIAVMGEALGSQYAELWQEVVYLHRKWMEYVALFGTKPTRLQLLNKAAPAFFRMVQDVLWEETLLHIARLTDPPDSGKGKDNLTIQNFLKLVDGKIAEKIKPLIDQIIEKSNFCRDWRNRRIAHRDLALALDQPVSPLENGSRIQVNELIDLIAEVMNAVALHYLDSQTHYRFDGHPGGATSLLYVLDDGIKTEAARYERLKNGKPLEEDMKPRNL